MRLASKLLLFGSREFTPLDIPDVQAFRRCDVRVFQNSNGTTPSGNGDPIGYIGDQSGNGRHLIQATTAAKPTLTTAAINGQPAAVGDGTDDFLASAHDGTALTALTVAVVIKPGVFSTVDGLWTWGNIPTSVATPFIQFILSAANTVAIYVNGATRFTIAHTANTTKSYILTADGTTWNLWVNGVKQTAYTGGFGANKANALSTYWLNGNTTPAPGQIPEDAIWHKVLADIVISGQAWPYHQVRYGL